MKTVYDTPPVIGRARHAVWRRRFVILSLLLAQGCGPSEGRLFDLHMANDPKAQAKKRWEAVRGSVKLQLAEEHLKAGRLDDAQRALEEAMAMCPNDPKAYVLTTRLRLEQGQLAEAREAITVAAQLNDNDPEIPYFAGLVAQRYGDLESAFEHYSAACAAAPQVAEYVLAQAETLVNLDRPVEALELLQSRLNDFDRNVPMRMLAARICRILGLRGPAIAFAREAVRIGDDDPRLAAELGLMLVWAERYREAIAVLIPAIDRLRESPAKPSNPKNAESESTPSPSVVRALARAYVETGQGAKALDVLKPVLAANSDDLIAWTLCARASLLMGDLNLSNEALQRVQGKGPATAEMHVLTAYTALRRGDFARARNEAASALKLDGRLAMAHCVAGEAAEALGEREEAIASYEAALEIDPEFNTARQRIDAIGGREQSKPPSTPEQSEPVASDLGEVVGSACPPEEAVP